ncbi:hypothetical protein RRG08_053807 [Elysia crispata]|uniref:Uncharacterized protein n=1 Tax=Elysia crispata TaxID=231223 RepID=A0AAE0Y4L2_9GAST|nr:hypothetical protein RRG08_053807 [Elysia crispata]
MYPKCTVARVYGDVQKVGVPFDIQLKKVAFYVPVQANHKLQKHIRRFCRETKKQRADHRMLYIVGVGGRMLGLAGTYKLCNAKRSCSVFKSLYRTNVYVELHELGHR